MDWSSLLNPSRLVLLVPILGLVGWIINSILTHRERMAMIANGMNPDAAEEAHKHGSASQQSKS